MASAGAKKKKAVMHWGAILNPINKMLTQASEISVASDKFGNIGWYRVVLKTTIRQSKSLESTILSYLLPGKTIHVISIHGRRAEIDLPVKGWVSIISSSGEHILERVQRAKLNQPMPSELFGEAFAETDEIDNTSPENIQRYIDDRSIVENFIGKTIQPESVFERFQLSSTEDLEKIQFLYCATVSAFVSLKLGGNAPILQRSHVAEMLNRFIQDDFRYGWGDVEGRLSRILNDYDLFLKSDDLIPWQIGPVARAAQEFLKENSKKAESFPDALHVYHVGEDTDGIFVMSGYLYLKPLYVRDDGLRCIRWYESEDIEAWYIDAETKSSPHGLARLEIVSSHPGVKTKVKWMIYDEVTASWRRKSGIKILPVTFSQKAL